MSTRAIIPMEKAAARGLFLPRVAMVWIKLPRKTVFPPPKRSGNKVEAQGRDEHQGDPPAMPGRVRGTVMWKNVFHLLAPRS